MDHLCGKLNINHQYITPYHPQCNRLNEKLNGELKSMMIKMTHGNEKNWDLELNRELWAYRITVKPNT